MGDHTFSLSEWLKWNLSGGISFNDRGDLVIKFGGCTRDEVGESLPSTSSKDLAEFIRMDVK